MRRTPAWWRITRVNRRIAGIKEVLETMVDLAREEMTMVCVTHEMGRRRAMPMWRAIAARRSQSPAGFS
jgi:hypothetical protein